MEGREDSLIWDATCPDTFASSYEPLATREAGAVAAVFAQSLLKGSTCLFDVNTFTIFAWYFIDDTLSSLGCFTCTKEFLSVPLDLQTVFTSSSQHTLSILSLSPGTYESSRSLGAGWLVCEELAGVCWALRFFFTTASR